MLRGGGEGEELRERRCVQLLTWEGGGLGLERLMKLSLNVRWPVRNLGHWRNDFKNEEKMN